MRLSESTVTQVRHYDNIVGIIEQYVSLKKRGRNYLGLCPFHSEKSPSFTVSPEKHIWHCFGCHESGDLISFVQKIDSLTFTETIRTIADKVGIEVIEEEGSSGYSKADEQLKCIRDLLVFLRDYWGRSLTTEKKQYFLQRGVSEEMITKFHLGFCSSENLQQYLLSKGFQKDIIEAACVTYTTHQGVPISRFKDRMMFPIMDYQGRTLGFGGRTLSADKTVAKYINSDDSRWFSKRKLLYGLYASKRGIREKKFVLVVEGYMDVIMAHQYGFTNTVGCMGTALTYDHAQKIKRFTDVVYLALDSDEAGQKAMERSYESLTQMNITTYIVRMDQKDPADVIKNQGAEAFQGFIDEAKPMIDFKLFRALKTYDKTKVENLSKIMAEVEPFIKQIKDPIQKNHYIHRLSSELNVNEEIIVEKIEKTRYSVEKFLISSDAKKTKYQKAEEYLIYLMATDSDLKKKILGVVSESDFVTDVYKGLMRVISLFTGSTQELLESIVDSEQKSLLSRLVFEEEGLRKIEGQETNWQDYVLALKSFITKKRVVEIKSKLKQLEAFGNEDEITILLSELQEIKKGVTSNG